MELGACPLASPTATAKTCRWILVKTSLRVRRREIQVPALLTMPRGRLARVEPAVAGLAALHALGVLAVSDAVSGWQWALAAALLALGVAGVAGYKPAAAAGARVLAVLAVVFSTAYVSGGVGSAMTIWFAVAALFYPAVMSERWSWI